MEGPIGPTVARSSAVAHSRLSAAQDRQFEIAQSVARGSAGDTQLYSRAVCRRPSPSQRPMRTAERRIGEGGKGGAYVR